jgi:DNA polymerase-3 subunit beta
VLKGEKMKISVDKKNIFTELSLLQGIVEKRNTMPILANILIETSENNINMIGTDLEVGLKTISEANVEEQGATTISGTKLFEIIK